MPLQASKKEKNNHRNAVLLDGIWFMTDLFVPEIVVLYCGRVIRADVHLSEIRKNGEGFRARFVMLPCSSKAEVGHFVKLIEEGADGVQLITCPEKACRFLTGNDAAKSRFKYAVQLLVETGMEGERLRMTRKSNLALEEMMTLAGEFAKTIFTLGENPMKNSDS
jgi:coenzyme F420-reducing hydrogenase delta subunit